MRPLSSRFVQSLNAPETDEVYVALLRVSHYDLQNEIWHLSSDNRDLLDYEQQLRGTVSRGVAYQFLPMEFSLPEQKSESSEMLEIRLSNVNQELSPILQSVRTPAIVELEIVLAAYPDEVEIFFPELVLTAATMDSGSVSLTLAVDSLTRETYPADNFTPGAFGSLWSTT